MQRRTKDKSLNLNQGIASHVQVVQDFIISFAHVYMHFGGIKMLR